MLSSRVHRAHFDDAELSKPLVPALRGPERPVFLAHLSEHPPGRVPVEPPRIGRHNNGPFDVCRAAPVPELSEPGVSRRESSQPPRKFWATVVHVVSKPRLEPFDPTVTAFGLPRMRCRDLQDRPNDADMNIDVSVGVARNRARRSTCPGRTRGRPHPRRDRATSLGAVRARVVALGVRAARGLRCDRRARRPVPTCSRSAAARARAAGPR